MYQTFLQFAGDYDHAQVRLGTPAFLQNKFGALRLQFFAPPIDAVAPRHVHFVLQLPNVSFQGDCFCGLRLCDPLEADLLGFVKTPQPQVDVHNDSYSDLMKHADNRLCEPKHLGLTPLQFVYDGVSFGVVHLTSLLAHFQSCSRRIAHWFRVCQPKSLAFGSPLAGL